MAHPLYQDGQQSKEHMQWTDNLDVQTTLELVFGLQLPIHKIEKRESVLMHHTPYLRLYIERQLVHRPVQGEACKLNPVAYPVPRANLINIPYP